MKKSLAIMIFVCFFLLGFSYTSNVFSEEEIFMTILQNENGSNIIKVYTPSTLENIYMEVYQENNEFLAGIHQDYYALEKNKGRTKNVYIINADFIMEYKDVSIVLFPNTEREDVYRLSDIEVIIADTSMDKTVSTTKNGIKVMSYNIHHGKNRFGLYTLNQVIDTIRENEIDIVGLQEVDKNVYRSRFSDQVKLMANELGMYYAFGSNINMVGMEYGNAILSKYPIENFENVHLPGFKEKRGLLKSRIKIDDRYVNFLVTHLGLTKQERKNQTNIIRKYVEFTGEKTILVGDFNSEYNSEDLKSINNVLMDASQETESHSKHTYEGLVIKSKIDYILVSPDIVVNNYDVLDINASDHFPILADLEF